MTLYGYARVSVREPEDKNLDLQVERLVRAGCSLGNIRAEEASGARNDRGGLLELLDLVVEGDTLVVTHIDRLSRGLTHGLQVIEGLHRAGAGEPCRSSAPADRDGVPAARRAFGHAGRLLTYEHLLERVWGEKSSGDVRPMRTIVSKLRRKLGDDADNPTYIFTEPRVGYRMPKSETALTHSSEGS